MRRIIFAALMMVGVGVVTLAPAGATPAPARQLAVAWHSPATGPDYIAMRQTIGTVSTVWVCPSISETFSIGVTNVATTYGSLAPCVARGHSNIRVNVSEISVFASGNEMHVAVYIGTSNVRYGYYRVVNPAEALTTAGLSETDVWSGNVG